MSSEVIKILDDLCARFGIAIDWTSENVIPQLEKIAESLVRYERATSIMWLVFGVILIAFGVALVIADIKFDCDGIFCTIGCGMIVIGMVLAISQITDIIACNTFPEKVLMDYLTHYMKGYR